VTEPFSAKRRKVRFQNHNDKKRGETGVDGVNGMVNKTLSRILRSCYFIPSELEISLKIIHSEISIYSTSIAGIFLYSKHLGNG